MTAILSANRRGVDGLDAIALIRYGECHRECLLARHGLCACRCEGRYHGAWRIWLRHERLRLACIVRLCAGCAHPGGQHILNGGCKLCPACPGWAEGAYGRWPLTYDGYLSRRDGRAAA